MRIIVTGASGQLGYDCVNNSRIRGHETVGVFRKNKTESDFIQLDLNNYQMVSEVIRNFDCLIHCAGWTDVDGAEDPQNYNAVHNINVSATETLAKACSKHRVKMIYISTDYVFDGSGVTPWKPEDKRFWPLSIYGSSKLDGENAVIYNNSRSYIVRTSWLFGKNGKNFVRTLIDLGKKSDSVRVVNDQIGRPTYSRDLARLLVDMAESDKYGIYHASNEGEYISWYDFCRYFYNLYGLKTEVIPVSTKEYGLNKAERPLNSRLDTSKLMKEGFKPLPTWDDAVKRYLSECNF